MADGRMWGVGERDANKSHILKNNSLKSRVKDQKNSDDIQVECRADQTH